MRKHRILRVLKIIVGVLLASVVFGLLIEGLWNWLMPVLFSSHRITFWQALGLFFLCKILFGGFHRHGGGRCKPRMWQRWQQMTPEEREKCRAGMGGWGSRFEPKAEPQS